MSKVVNLSFSYPHRHCLLAPIPHLKDKDHETQQQVGFLLIELIWTEDEPHGAIIIIVVGCMGGIAITTGAGKEEWRGPMD